MQKNEKGRGIQVLQRLPDLSIILKDCCEHFCRIRRLLSMGNRWVFQRTKSRWQIQGKGDGVVPCDTNFRYCADIQDSQICILWLYNNNDIRIFDRV